MDTLEEGPESLYKRPLTNPDLRRDFRATNLPSYRDYV